MSEIPVPEWAYRGELTLAALPNAIACARLLARHTLTASRLDVDAAYRRRLEQVTEELVTHAVATTGVTAAVPLYDDIFEHLALLTVRLRLTLELAQIEVWDSGARPPHPRLGQTPAMQTSNAWGYDWPAPGHRVVWCVVPLAPSSREQAERPRPPRTDASPPAPARDPELLQRVLDGLRRMDSHLPEEET